MTDSISEALLACAKDGNLEGYAEAIAAVPVQRLSTIGNVTSFQQSVAALLPATESGDSLSRLKALALIGRADKTTQQKVEAIAEVARAAMRTKPPPLDPGAQEGLKPEDRYYISLVVARSDDDWVLPYAATALIEERAEPKSRDLERDPRTAWARIVFDRAPTLAEAFQSLAASIPGSSYERPGTKDAELSRAKRIAKLLPPIEDALRRSLKDSGENLPESFAQTLHQLVFRYSRPSAGSEADGAVSAVAQATLSLLGTLLRTRFSIAILADSYRPVTQLKYWVKGRAWPKETREARERLSQSLLEAIAVRAAMGKASRELLAILVQLEGHRPRVERLLGALADRPDVPADVQDWLRAGGKQTAPQFRTEAAEEAGLRDVDAILASAAVRGAQVRRLVEGRAGEALEAFRERKDMISHALHITQALNSSRALANDIDAVVRRRGFELIGQPGEVVPTDAQRHRRRDGLLIETELVKIETPGVQRVLPNGTTEIILHAIVVESED